MRGRKAAPAPTRLGTATTTTHRSLTSGDPLRNRRTWRKMTGEWRRHRTKGISDTPFMHGRR